jgi:diguanylate cyclase
MTIEMGRLVSSEANLLPDKAALLWFDRIRELLVSTGLAPLPEVYDLLWRYVHDDSHELSLAVDTAIACDSFDLAAVTALRRAHCGEVDTTLVRGLVEAAHGQAEALTRHIEAGRTGLADYGRAIADGGVALGTPLDANGLAALLDQLGEATTIMQAANTRLEVELAAAAATARALSEKLGFAERAAITDPLTGVLNRRGTFEALERLQGETRAAGRKLATTLIDIDHFKRFNDRFGHALGDDVLRFVARHVADRIAPSGGIVGRLGGEEFVALLPDHDVLGAVAMIDRVRADLAGQIVRNASDGTSMGRISFSAGVAGDRASDDADSLIKRADKALYGAKRLGRDRVLPELS